MVDYARALASARRGIRGSGRPVAFVKLKTAPANPNAPLHGPAPDDPEDNPENRLAGIFATFVPISSMQELGMTAQAIQLFKNCDQVALVEAPEGGEDLKTYDVCDDGGTRWYLDRVLELKPGDVVIMYYVGMSRTKVSEVSA